LGSIRLSLKDLFAIFRTFLLIHSAFGYGFHKKMQNFIENFS